MPKVDFCPLHICPHVESPACAHTGLHEVCVLGLLCLDNDLAFVLCLSPSVLQTSHAQLGPHCSSPLSVIRGTIPCHLLRSPSFCSVSLRVF